MKLDRELADSILKLRPYAAFQKFVDAIQQDGAEAMLDMVNAPTDQVGRLQGRAGYALEIQSALAQAAEVLEKIERKQPTGENGDVRSTRISSQGRGAF